MGLGSGIRAGAAYVELNVKDRIAGGLAKAAAKLKAFGAMVQQIGMGMMAAGAAIAAPLLPAAKIFADTGSALNDMSARTGLAVETLSELGFVAKQTGADINGVETAVRAMQKVIGAAGRGVKTAKDGLARLGLTYADLEKLTPEAQFMLLLQQLAKLPAGATRAAMAMKIFGNSGTSLLPMLSRGVEGFEELRQQARDLGIVISTEDAAKADEFGDVLDALWAVVKHGVFVIGGALAPMLQQLAQFISEHVQKVTEWISRNRGLVTSILKLAAGLVAAGAGLNAFGFVAAKLGSVLGIVASSLSVIGTVMGALLSPMGMVVALAAALGGYLLWSSGNGAKALSWLGEKFMALKEFATKSFKGIADALAAGDIALAGKILWLSLKIIWLQGAAKLTEIWVGLKRFALGIWFGIQAAWEEMVDAMVRAWIYGMDGIKEAFSTITDLIAKTMLDMGVVFQGTAGEDLNYDPEAAKKIIDTEARLRRDRLHDKYKDELAAQDRIHQDALSKIGDEDAATQEKLDNQVKAAKDAVAAARKEWEDAIELAGDERAALEMGPPAPGKAKPKFDFNLPRIVSDVAQKMAVRGTFNVAAIQGLKGGDAIERTADAAEETAKNTRKMLDDLDNMEGLEFS